MKLLVALFLSSFSCKQTVWFADFDEIKKKAGEQHKLILLNFSGYDWCDACNAWSKQLFKTPTFKTVAANHLLLLNADYSHEKKYLLPKHLQQQYDGLLKKYNPTKQFPFTVLINEDGKKLAEWNLSQMFSPEKFINDINRTVYSYSLALQNESSNAASVKVYHFD